MNTPIQPLYEDSNNKLRFKQNDIVKYLLESHPRCDLNEIARLDFPIEDLEQFYQLIGVSLNMFGEISRFTDETYYTAETMYKRGVSENQARISYLQGKIEELTTATYMLQSGLFDLLTMMQKTIKS